MNSLSRENRKVIELWEDYFEMYEPDGFKNFYQSKNCRCYFNHDVYPAFKIDMHHFFKNKDYYPETHLENPMADGIWYVKPNKGANGDGIIITDDNVGVLAIENDAPEFFPLGETNVTWTATDNSENGTAHD